MTPEQIRNANWAEIEKHMQGSRETVYNCLLAFGRCTTSELALKMQHSVLSVRPRITELCDLGLVELVGKAGHEGIYQTVPVYIARQLHDRQRAQNMQQGQQLTLL
jgi:hypothetical protein